MPLKSNPKEEVVVTSKLRKCELDPSDYYKNKASTVSLTRGWKEEGCDGSV